MENSYLDLRWRTKIHGAEQKRWRENQSLWSWCVEAGDWGYIWWRERIGDATAMGEDWRLFLVFSKKFWWNHDLQIARYRNRNGKLPFLKRENLLIQKCNPTNFAQPNICWFLRFDKRPFSSLNTPKQTGSECSSVLATCMWKTLEMCIICCIKEII